MPKSNYVWLAASGALIALLLTSLPCTPVKRQEPLPGSHGLRTWYGASLMSFEHDGNKVCVPEGWEPVAYESKGNDWARYRNGATGVLIRSAAFASTTLSLAENSYHITLLYPEKTEEAERRTYESMVQHSFERVSSLYENEKVRTHTVLVTAGLTANDSEAASIYPDPGPDTSFVILRPSTWRSEELLLHAIMHLHNRQWADFAMYADAQTPLAPGDFEELEASWAEIAFEQSAAARSARVKYLYGIHTAVMARDFSRIEGPPFNDAAAFKKLRPGAIAASDWTYLEEQYGHYVLAPLTLTAVDALLAHEGNTASVELLLKRIHRTDENFFTVLEEHLSEKETATVKRWLRGEEVIPESFLQEAVLHYNKKSSSL